MPGQWKCRNGFWAWVTPSPTPTPGCGPQPAIPTGLTGKGKWECKNGTWTWVPKTGPAPAPGCGVAQVHVAKGKHALVLLNHKSQVTGHQPFTLDQAATWCAGLKGIATDGKSQLHVVQLATGPHAGHYINVNAAGITWSRA
jgi:hypothetical protein